MVDVLLNSNMPAPKFQHIILAHAKDDVLKLGLHALNDAKASRQLATAALGQAC